MNFGTLPLEVILCIVEQLDVRSVIELSWVSMRLHGLITSYRSLWLALASRVLCGEGHASSAFDLASLGTPELVLCATRKARLTWSANNSAQLGVERRDVGLELPPVFPLPIAPPEHQSHVQNQPHSDVPPASTPTPVFRESILLPGGRWLVGLSGAERSWSLSCWDLSCTPSATFTEVTRLLPVAVQSLAGEMDVHNPCSPAMLCRTEYKEPGRGVKGSGEFRILVRRSYPGQYLYEVLILGIIPDPGNSSLTTAAFTQRYTSPILPRRPEAQLAGPYALISFPNSTHHSVVWNWESCTDHLISLTPDDPEEFAALTSNNTGVGELVAPIGVGARTGLYWSGAKEFILDNGRLILLGAIPDTGFARLQFTVLAIQRRPLPRSKSSSGDGSIATTPAVTANVAEPRPLSSNQSPTAPPSQIEGLDDEPKRPEWSVRIESQHEIPIPWCYNRASRFFPPSIRVVDPIFAPSPSSYTLDRISTDPILPFFLQPTLPGSSGQYAFIALSAAGVPRLLQVAQSSVTGSFVGLGTIGGNPSSVAEEHPGVSRKKHESDWAVDFWCHKAWGAVLKATELEANTPEDSRSENATGDVDTPSASRPSTPPQSSSPPTSDPQPSSWSFPVWSSPPKCSGTHISLHTQTATYSTCACGSSTSSGPSITFPARPDDERYEMRKARVDGFCARSGTWVIRKELNGMANHRAELPSNPIDGEAQNAGAGADLGPSREESEVEITRNIHVQSFTILQFH